MEPGTWMKLVRTPVSSSLSTVMWASTLLIPCWKKVLNLLQNLIVRVVVILPFQVQPLVLKF